MNSIESNPVPLKDITATLVRRKWLITITFFAIVAGVTTNTLRLPKQYEAHMKILVKNERAQMVVAADTTIGSGYRGEVSEAQINTEIELLNGDNLLGQVVTKCRLERLDNSSGTVAR